MQNYVEFRGESISGTFGAIPDDLEAFFLKKTGKFAQTVHFGFGEYLTIRSPTVVTSSDCFLNSERKIITFSDDRCVKSFKKYNDDSVNN